MRQKEIYPINIHRIFIMSLSISSCCENKTFDEVKDIIKQQSAYELETMVDLLVKCKENKRILDMEYDWIYFYISCIQT